MICREEEVKIADSENIIRLSKLKKKFGEKTVLDIESLELKKGKIIALIGPNGAGKSTLLRVINLLTQPDCGEYYYAEEDVLINKKKDVHLQRKMAFVFQKTLLFKESVNKNIAYGLEARGIEKTIISERVAELTELMGIADLGEQRADSLSGGEAQRVALARAVAFRPELLLLDEPTANLDPHNVELIEKIIQKLNREDKITVLIVTHNIYQARRLADEVVFLREGRVVEMGKTEMIFSTSAKEETRDYLEGRMIF